MNKIKTPIIIANWKGNILDLNEVKNKLKNIDKEYTIYSKKRAKEIKKKNIKKDLIFQLAIPSPLIYPIQEFVKENKNYKKLSVGAQNFDEIEKVNKNNVVTLSQVKSAGAKFVILNNEDTNKPKKDDLPTSKVIHKKEEVKNKITANDLLLSRLNSINKKTDKKLSIEEKPLEDEELKKIELFEKIHESELQKLEEKVSHSLQNKFSTVLVIRDNSNDLNLLIEFIKRIIKNIHYNLFNNLIICYETDKGMDKVDRMEIEDCQEKTIAIRRTVANMFGIDNAKKIKIIYSGRINESNAREIMENGGIDGLMITGDSLIPKTFAQILVEVNK